MMSWSPKLNLAQAVTGAPPCRVLLVLPSSWPPKFAANSRPSAAPVPLPRPWSCAVASSCVPPAPTSPPTLRSPPDSAATATPPASGASVSSPRALWAFRTRPAPAGPGVFPPQTQAAVVSIACGKTTDHDRPCNGWTLDEIAFTIVNEAHARAISRATIWRILDAADLKPHKSIYWLNSHDPDFEAKAKAICSLYLDAPRLYRQGHLVLCCDEKTGMQVLDRAAPTRLAIPGHREKREFEYVRLGTRTLMGTFCVPTGEVVWDLGQTRTSWDFRSHILRVAKHFEGYKRFDWVVDNLNTHMGLELCEALAHLNGVAFEPKKLQTMTQRQAFLSTPGQRHVFHYVPRHGSWLNQVELFFSVLTRQFLRRGAFKSLREFEKRLGDYLDEYNQEKAHPYRWTYTGEPLVRHTPQGQTARQRRLGRAWFGTRPQLFQRLIHPPRPYHRKPKTLATNF